MADQSEHPSAWMERDYRAMQRRRLVLVAFVAVMLLAIVYKVVDYWAPGNAGIIMAQAFAIGAISLVFWWLTHAWMKR